MSETTVNENGEVVISRLKLLKAEADELGLEYPKNITADVLEAKIDAYRAELQAKANEPKEEKEPEPEEDKDTVVVQAYNPSVVGRVRDEAFKQIRFKLIVNDPSLQEATGIQVTAGNDIVGHVTRVIPTNAEVWHAEAIIVEHLKNQRFQQFKTKTNNRGIQYMDNRDAVLIPRFTIIELAPLTEQELEDLRRLQSQNNTGRSLD